MSKMSKAVAVLGVVAGLGVAAMPLSTYAATDPVDANAIIKATVEDTIAIDITEGTGGTFTGATDTNPAMLDLGKLMMGGAASVASLNVNVYSNTATQKYSLTVTPAAADKINMEKTDDATKNIPAAAPTDPTATTPVFKATTGGWAFKGGALTNWTALANAGSTLTAADAVTGTAADKTLDGVKYSQSGTTEVSFAAAAGTDTIAGGYKVELTFTATAAK